MGILGSRHNGSDLNSTSVLPPVPGSTLPYGTAARPECSSESLAAWLMCSGETQAAPSQASAAEAVTRVIDAIDSLPDAFMVLDVEGYVRWASSGTSEVLGWHPNDLVGRPISVIALEENVERQQQHLHEMRRTGSAVSYTTHRRHGDGGVVEVLVSMAPLSSSTGEFVGTCASIRNMTHQKRLQTQLVEQEHVSMTLNRRSSDVSLMSKPDTEITYISPSVVDVLGYTPDQIVGTKGLLLVHEDDLAGVSAFVSRVVSTPDAVERLTFRITNAQGDWMWIEETLTNCVNVPGVRGLVGNVRDVTGEVEARVALTASERRYRTIVETAQEGVIVLDHDTTLLFANRKAAELFGHAQTAIHRRKLTSFLDSATAEDVRRRSASRSRRGHERYEVTYPHPDGRDRVFEVSASPMALDADGDTGTLAMISDVTDARFAESELRRRALHDALTGLPNRALFDDRLSMALSRQTHEPDHPTVAVLSIDLDGFKLINEVHGHDVGDVILVEVAHRLRDASGPADTVARTGGDEFVVVAEGVDVDAAVTLADRMRQAMLEPITIDATVVYVDASIGVALAASPDDPSTLLRAANAALSQAKTQGRARVHVYNASCASDTARKLRLASALREALATDQISLGYQPIVDLTDGRVVAVEALLRWEHPDLGYVPPPEVIATAHATGLAERLDRYVLRRACSDMTRLRDRGATTDITLAVNLSSPSFDSRLPQTVSDTGRLTGWPLHLLSLEITENVLMSDPATAAIVLAQLRELDVSVAIDDFGTGYSSLAYLKRLPVATLKVDRTFVEQVPDDPESCAIARSVTDLARALALTTVAEGIETQDQADFMRRLGCTRGQGYLWSPAVSPNELEALLLAWPT